MVVYTGREAWDGARTLKEMLNLTGLDRMIQKMIADYPINLLEVRAWENLEWFRSDIKEVFGFLKYTQDKEQLRNFIEENQKAFSDMEEEAYDFIASASHTKEMKEIKPNIKTGGGGYDILSPVSINPKEAYSDLATVFSGAYDSQQKSALPQGNVLINLSASSAACFPYPLL